MKQENFLGTWARRSGLQRIEAVVLALMLALPVAFLAFGEAPAFADSDEDEAHGSREYGDGKFRNTSAAPAAAPADGAALAALKSECGGCHIPYPARMLPAASWQKIMGSLGDHYGSDATLDDAAIAAQITGVLVRNAGDAARLKDSQGAAVPMRITQTRWFIREHDELGASVWKRPAIKSAANCSACHQAAADGNFSERGIRIPKP